LIEIDELMAEPYRCRGSISIVSSWDFMNNSPNFQRWLATKIESRRVVQIVWDEAHVYGRDHYRGSFVRLVKRKRLLLTQTPKAKQQQQLL